MNEAEIWKKIEHFFEVNFQTEKNPPIETFLFIIGVQELGSGQQKFTKDDKVNLVHIAVCRLLEPFGYYKFTHYENGWPQFEKLDDLPELKPNEQSLLMKKAPLAALSLWATSVMKKVPRLLAADFLK